MLSTCVRHRYRADECIVEPDTIPAEEVLDLIYANNNSLVTHTGRDGDTPSSSSAPSLMAKMLEALDVQPRHRVLEIGAGTGYNAASTCIYVADVDTVFAAAGARVWEAPATFVTGDRFASVYAPVRPPVGDHDPGRGREPRGGRASAGGVERAPGMRLRGSSGSSGRGAVVWSRSPRRRST